jgi:chemotaxis protein histidine kinase CheA
MIVQDEPPLPSTVASTASPIFDAIVKKALAKDPVRCFQNAKEFSAALREGLKIEFSRTGENRTVALPARSEQRPPAALLPENEVELEYWRSIKDGNDPAEFEIYLKKFPSGEYVDLAKHKVTKLRGGLDASAEQTIVASRPTEQKRNTGLLLVIGVAVAIAGAGIYFVLDKKAKELQIALKAEEEKRVQEQQARVKAEADHKAAAQAIKEKEEARIAAEKAAAEKAVAKKILAEKIAADKLAAERAAAKKAAEKEAVRRQAEKEAQEREAVERAARERAEQERIAAERAAADRAAAERAAAEAAADRAAAQRAAAQRSQADSKMADASYSYSKGLAYASGSGVIQNDFEAVRWYQRAAALNHPGALNNLGVMYQAGRGGLPRDRNEALRLYRRAAAMGNDVARRNAERLEGR